MNLHWIIHCNEKSLTTQTSTELIMKKVNVQQNVLPLLHTVYIKNILKGKSTKTVNMWL